MFKRAGILIIIFGLFQPLLLLAGTEVEYRIKAAYLYNFTKFITWPEIQGERFNICLLGEDPFGNLIAPVETKKSHGYPIKLIRMPHFDADSKCHIIFINGDVSYPANALSKDILTVRNSEILTQQNIMIGFVIKDKKVRLQINLQAVKSSTLSISAKLMEVADVIGGGDE